MSLLRFIWLLAVGTVVSLRISAQVVEIPVVVHIVSTNPGKITDQYVRDGIQDLNDAFAHTGKYASLGPGINTKIKFCLVQTDPLGGNTTGITRTQSVLGDFDKDIENLRMKNLVSWDTKKYCNIWLVDSLKNEIFPLFNCGAWERSKEDGYATPPPGGGFADGIVVTKLGDQVLAHNMGHYLGLQHSFVYNDCENSDCTTSGDGICDTPPSKIPAADCATLINSCSTDETPGGPVVFDLMQNFMTYDPCSYAFTKGQADRMMFYINGDRKTLLWNGRCDRACPENVFAQFTRSEWFPTPATTVQFTSTNGSSGSIRQWFVNGADAGSGNSLSYTFNAVGKYGVSFKTYNGDDKCFGSQLDSIVVTCGVMARFVPDKRVIASKAPIKLERILFKNRSVGSALNFEWRLSEFPGYVESVVSSDRDLDYEFQDSGRYRIRLVAKNGTCTDTTEYFNFTVEDPTVDGVIEVISVECEDDTKVKVKFAICNKGYQAIPAGTPIGFYDADPRLPGANRIGGSYLLPRMLKGKCCIPENDAEPPPSYTIDVGYKGVKKVYAVFNDKGNPVPFNLDESNTLFPEFNYDNNYSLFASNLFNIEVSPKALVLEPDDVVTLTASISPDVTVSRWDPSPRLSCTNCLVTNYKAGTTADMLTFFAENGKGCRDAVKVPVTIPPWNDYVIRVDPPECLDKDRQVVQFTLCNDFAKGGVVPAGIKVTFYDGDPRTGTPKRLGSVFELTSPTSAKCGTFSHPIDKTTTGIVFGVVNDDGAVPWAVPAGNLFEEKTYANNLASAAPASFSVDINPKNASLAPGDVVTFTATVSPNITAYSWLASPRLSCTNCLSPSYTAGNSPETLEFTAENAAGCKETVKVPIAIPPFNDYNVRVSDLQCFQNDKLTVGFRLCNLFAKGGVVPAGLKVTFYDGDPRTGSPKRLDPVFTVPAPTTGDCGNFSHVIQTTTTGFVFAVVNDDGDVPWGLPADVGMEEGDYSNNLASIPYVPEKLELDPKSVTVLLNTKVEVKVVSPLAPTTTVTWQTDPGYVLLGCTTGCLTNEVVVRAKSLLKVRSTEKNGCTRDAEVELNILPPDMRLEINSSSCFSNTQTHISFTVHMGNGYDTVFKDIPVVFYDGDPMAGSSVILQTFLTPQKLVGPSARYSVVVPTPKSGHVYMRVNQKSGVSIPDPVFPETDFSNNQVKVPAEAFKITISPKDTTVTRLTTLNLSTSTVSGTASTYAWKAASALSCTDCPNPVIKVPFSQTITLLAQNQFSCTDSDTLIVKTYTDKRYNLPTAFTPNGDGLNDVFYMIGNREIAVIREFSVYDRYGQRFFHRTGIKPNDPVYGWDGTRNGKPVTMGTYAYTFRVELVDGTIEFLKGLVTVIR